MNKLIIFDFNRTLYDPDRRDVMPGAIELLKLAGAKNYRLILLSQAVPSRAHLITDLGLDGYFAEILLVEHKHPGLLVDIANRHQGDVTQSFVIGDRALREVKLGHDAGWRTIWLQAGHFADEAPVGYTPTYTVTRLDQIPPFI